MMPRADAVIAPDDRGFRYGDGVFETIALIQSIPYLWDSHIARLREGLDVLAIAADVAGLRDQVAQLAATTAITDGMVRITISRGAGSSGYLPTNAGDSTILVELTPCPTLVDAPPPSLSLYMSTWRRFPPQCLPTHIKCAQGLNATLARQEAQIHDCDEALMLSYSGHICEAASGNLFWLQGNRLVTPPLSTGCLAGTMRARLMQLWDDDVQESVMLPQELETIDALVMTNALRGAVAITHIHTPSQLYHFSQSAILARTCQSLIKKDIAITLSSA